MKNKTVMLLLVLIIILVGGNLAAEENYLYKTMDATILASRPDEAARILTEWANQEGGYFTLMSTNQVILRIPQENASSFRPFLESSFEELFSFSSQAQDLRQDIQSFSSGIEARQEILQKNLKLVNKADFNGTLYLEQEILRLMGEIESLNGKLRKAQNDRRMAQAIITINFKSQTLPDSIPSSFGWINTFNFYQTATGSFSGRGNGNDFHITLPEGFAFITNHDYYRAMSPEGVRFQVRKVKNYPNMDVDFWAETLTRQMGEVGYRLNGGDGEFFDTKLGKAFSAEWGLPLDQRDFLFLTVIIPHKNWIYIVEATGDMIIYREYRDAIKKAVESIRP